MLKPEGFHAGPVQASTNGHSSGNRGSTDPTMLEAVAVARGQVAEIARHVGTLIEVQADRARSSLERRAIQAVFGSLLFLGLSAATIAASLMIVKGVGGAFSAAFPAHAWAGNLLGGLLVLLAIAGAAALGWSLRSRARFRQLAAKYAAKARRREGARETSNGHADAHAEK